MPEKEHLITAIYKSATQDVFYPETPDDQDILQEVFPEAPSVEKAVEDLLDDFEIRWLQVAKNVLDELPHSVSATPFWDNEIATIQQDTLNILTLLAAQSHYGIMSEQPYHLHLNENDVEEKSKTAQILSFAAQKIGKTLHTIFEKDLTTAHGNNILFCQFDNVGGAIVEHHQLSKNWFQIPKIVRIEDRNIFALYIPAHEQVDRFWPKKGSQLDEILKSFWASRGELEDFFNSVVSYRKQNKFPYERMFETLSVIAEANTLFKTGHAEYDHTIFEWLPLIDEALNTELGDALLSDQSLWPILTNMIQREFQRAQYIKLKDLDSKLGEYARKREQQAEAAGHELNKQSMIHFLKLLKQELQQQKSMRLVISFNSVNTGRNKKQKYSLDKEHLIKLTDNSQQFAHEGIPIEITLSPDGNVIIRYFDTYSSFTTELPTSIPYEVAYELLIDDEENQIRCKPTLDFPEFRNNKWAKPDFEDGSFDPFKIDAGPKTYLSRLLEALQVIQPLQSHDLSNLSNARQIDLPKVLANQSVLGFLKTLQEIDFGSYPYLHLVVDGRKDTLPSLNSFDE